MEIQAVVITEDHYNALGMVRSLGEAGIGVSLILTSDSKQTYVDKSKYVKKCFIVKHNCQEIISAIHKAISADSKSFLFPLSDYSAELVDANRNAFGYNVVVPHMNGQISMWQNKDISKRFAEQNGLQIAESEIICLSSDEVSTPWAKYPAIIKPLISIEGLKSHISIVNSGNELLAKLRWFKSIGYTRVMVEEYIHGDNEYMVEVLGYANGEEVIVSGIIEKIREYPMGKGSTSYARIVSSVSGLNIDNVVNYIKGLNYNGLFDMEFKHSGSIPYFIECNFRNGAPGYALTCVGKNIPVQWIQANTGKQINLVRNGFTNKDTFMCEQTDFLNVLKKIIPLTQWLRERSLSNCLFAVRGDMRPVYMYYYLFSKRVIAGIWRKIKRE